MNYQIVKSIGEFPIHVVDSTGLPHKELTLYACSANQLHSEKTARAYLREIVAFASWADSNQTVCRQNWKLLASEDNVRSMFSFFLKEEMKCVVAIGKDVCGFETRRIEPTWGTRRRLERLFAALRSFYCLLISKGCYGYTNPMEGDHARELIEDERHRLLIKFSNENARLPMPVSSGVDQLRYKRNSAAYFRLRGDQWMPAIIDDPSLFNTTLKAGQKWGWTLREIGLVRVLFDSGCRIHEACALTMADWVNSNFQNELTAISKGSHGRRLKRLFITQRTVKILHQYVNEQRIDFDPHRRTVSDFSKLPLKTLESTPLFLTRLGTAVSADHFRRNFWTPALNLSHVKLRIHQVRHWFVTMALNDFYQRADSDEHLQKLRSEFRELMAWKSDMLPVYDQSLRHHNLPDLARNIHERIEIEQTKAREQLRNYSKNSNLKSETQQMLEEMLNP